MLRSYIYKPDYIDNTIDLNSNAAKELDWMSFWEQLFVKSVNSSLDSFAHLNEELKKEQNSEKKTLPMNLEEDALTASEEKSMIQSGYLTKSISTSLPAGIPATSPLVLFSPLSRLPSVDCHIV